MKVRASIKKRCADCKMVRRSGHLYVLCRTKPSHKQKQ
ncbi:50S ribosomal protein L36 [Candidatus Nomurabacteria bacterium]|nr:50S ribosomal protein L36 [Candidatus Nomurabacteria bacterium]